MSPDRWHAALAADPLLPDCSGTHLMGYGFCQRLAAAELAGDQAGHRTDARHDCFAMNCQDLGTEVQRFRQELAATAVVELDVEALAEAIAYALARAELPSDQMTSRDYARRLAPLVLESGWLATRPAAELEVIEVEGREGVRHRVWKVDP